MSEHQFGSTLDVSSDYALSKSINEESSVNPDMEQASAPVAPEPAPAETSPTSVSSVLSSLAQELGVNLPTPEQLKTATPAELESVLNGLNRIQQTCQNRLIAAQTQEKSLQTELQTALDNIKEEFGVSSLEELEALEKTSRQELESSYAALVNFNPQSNS